MCRVFDVTYSNSYVCNSSSKGNQAKWKIDSNFIKQDFLGHESIAEVVSSRLASCIKDFNYIEYNLCSIIYKEIQYHDCCISKNFLKEGSTLYSLYRLFEIRDMDIEKELKNFSTDVAILKIQKVLNLDDRTVEDIGRMLLFDAIILNEDRHFNNICFIRTEEGLALSPVFDNGGSLLSDLKYYPLIYGDFKNIISVKSKPFSTNFNKQIEGVLKLGIQPLQIDRSKFNRLVDNLEIPKDYKHYYDRSVKVVNIMLDRLEGKAWQAI